MSAQQQITNAIRQRVAAGEDVMTALRAVCGAQLIDDMIADVWRTLRERAGVAAVDAETDAAIASAYADEDEL